MVASCNYLKDYCPAWISQVGVVTCGHMPTCASSFAQVASELAAKAKTKIVPDVESKQQHADMLAAALLAKVKQDQQAQPDAWPEFHPDWTMFPASKFSMVAAQMDGPKHPIVDFLVPLEDVLEDKASKGPPKKGVKVPVKQAAPAPEPAPVTDTADEGNACCGTCKYSRDMDSNWVQCRRYPPTTIDDDGDGVFPNMHRSRGWCGEWQ